MSGATDHGGLEVLDFAECERLLTNEYVGRVAFVDAGEPIILPVNYVYRDGVVLIRTAEGSKLDAASMRSVVAFEIDGHDDEYHSGWSVLVVGVMEELDGDEEREYENLPLTPWAKAVPRTHWLRIRADRITGRRLP
jgi:uncharacterized protein